MAMTFYNPGSLLADPSVAVKPPPPETDMAAFAIGEAMLSIKENLTKKKRVDDLKAQTNLMADYMESRSPELASMLRKRTDQYNPTAFAGYDAVDVEKEKDSLLKGVIDLYGKDLQEKRIDASGNSASLNNNWANKLRASESILNNVSNNWNSWESAENRREAEYEENRRELAKVGKADGIPPFTRKENPYAPQKAAAEATYNQLLQSGPEEISSMATAKKVASAGSSIVPGSYSEPPVPSYGLETPMTNAEKEYDINSLFPDTSGRSAPADDFGGFLDTNGAPIPLTLDQDSQSTEVRKPEAVDTPMPSLTSKQLIDAMSGGNDGVVGKEVTPPVASSPVGDPVAILNEAAKQKMSGNVKAVTTSLDTIIKGIKRESGTYIDKNTADQAIQEGERIKEELSSLPDPGSDEWVSQARMIVSAYRSSLSALQRNSAASEKKEQQVANQEQLQYYVKGSITKDPITVYKRIQDGIPRFYILEQGKEVEVTNRIGADFLPLNPADGTAPTNTTKPGAKPLSVKDLLNI